MTAGSTYPSDAEDPESPEQKATAALNEASLLKRLKRWYKASLPAAQKWRENARKDFAMRDGDQWDEEAKQKLNDECRPVITFNKLAPIIDAVSGMEINQRQDLTCKQRGLEDTAIAEVATALVDWAGDQCDAPDAHSDSFTDTLIGGMGWVEARIDDIGELRYVEAQVDAFEMVWDSGATFRRNLEGARYVFRCRQMDIEAAREMFPNKSRSVLNATWAHPGGGDGEPWVTPRRAYEDASSKYEEDDDEGKVTIVEAQWRELESYGEIVHADGHVEEVDEGSVDTAMQRLSIVAMQTQQPPPQGARKKKRWVVYQAFIGREILEPRETLPTNGALGYQCITGKYDRKQKVHYGIIRAASDPQKWANKWMSQGLYILDTTAKNAILYEDGAFGDTDHETVKSDLAQVGALIKTAPGAITGGKIQRQDSPAFPTGYYQLMEFALSAIRDCTGVNQETLGLMTRDQAGILENQRKQQTIAMLALYFDNLRRCLKNLGQIRLSYLCSGIFPEEDLADAIGPELNVPPEPSELDPQPMTPLQRLLADEEHAIRFDIQVDESPASPNSKERNWVIMQPLLQMLLARKDIPNEVYLAIMESSPLPGHVYEALKKALANAGPTPEQQAEQAAQKDIMKRGAEAKIRLDESKATQAMADAQKTEMEAGVAAVQGLVGPLAGPGQVMEPLGAPPMPPGGMPPFAGPPPMAPGMPG